MRWRRRWDDDWFDWEEDGPKLIKRIVLGVISAALAVAGCFVFVSSNVGMFGGGIHEGFVSDSFEETSEAISSDDPMNMVYAKDFTFEKVEGQEAYCVTGLSEEGETKTDIVIPSMYNRLPVIAVDAHAFSDCKRLTSVVIPDSITSMGGSSFFGCSALTEITLPFVGATGHGVNRSHFGYIFGATTPLKQSEYIPGLLEKVTIRGGDIASSAFYNCSSLTSVVIGDSVTSIGNHAFQNCSSLTSVVIPDSVTMIGEWAFSSCSSLTSVVISDSVTSIGEGAFYNCSKLAEIKVSENNTVYQSIDGNLYSKAGSVLIQYAIGKTATEFVIPECVTSIGSSAFYYCDSLTSVVIPDSVTSIGSSAFYYCSSLTSVVIGDSVTTIDDYAFYDCYSYKTVYYKGAASEWSSISIGYNPKLTSATRYYYDESESVEMWWHYDAQGNVVHA